MDKEKNNIDQLTGELEELKMIESEFISPPIRPINGTEAIELLKQNKCIEVPGEVTYWFIERLDKDISFNYSYYFNRHSNNWTIFNKVEK